MMTQPPLISLEEWSERLKYWTDSLIDKDKAFMFEKLSTFVQSDVAIDIFNEMEKQYNASDDWAFLKLRQKILGNHKSLSITSNITARIDWRSTQSGLKKITHFVHAFLQIHAKYLKGEGLDTDYYKDNPLVEAQLLRFLSGSCRRSNVPYDDLYFNNVQLKGCERNIIVIFKGCAWKLTVIDSENNVASPAQIENVLYELVQATTTNADMPFTIPSLIDARIGMDVRKQLLCRDENSKIMQTVENALFCLSLDDTHYFDDEEALFEASFGQGSHVWGYKPLNFIYHSADNHIFAQIERASLDLNLLNILVNQARKIYESHVIHRGNTLKNNLSVKSINWRIDGRKVSKDTGLQQKEIEGTYKKLNDAWHDYQYSSEKWFVSLHDVFMTDEEEKKIMKYDRKMLNQLLLQYAQFSLHQQFSGMLEYIDMSDIIGNHFDYMSQLTNESIYFIERLFHRQASFNDFERAVNAYDKRRKIVRDGRGVWGYTLALQHIASQKDAEIKICDQAVMSVLMEPEITAIYLNSSMINQVVIPPHHKKGLGVFCFGKRNHLNFVITHPRHQINDVKVFSRAITSGLKQMLQLLSDG